MKKNILLFLVLVVLLPLTAWAIIIIDATVSTVGGCADSSCTGFLICQNFEGTGYDNGENGTWTESEGAGANIDADSTSPLLRGSQSLQIFSGTGASYLYKDIAATNEIYAHFRVRITSDSGNTFLKFMNGSTNLFFSGYNSAANKFIYNGANITSAMSLDTEYHVWMYYKAGTGADAVITAWVSANCTRPAVTDFTSSAWNGTLAANRVMLYSTASSGNVVYDQVIVRAANIGDVCE